MQKRFQSSAVALVKGRPFYVDEEVYGVCVACHAVVKESAKAEHARVCKVYTQDRSKVMFSPTRCNSLVSWNSLPVLYGKGVKCGKKPSFLSDKLQTKGSGVCLEIVMRHRLLLLRLEFPSTCSVLESVVFYLDSQPE